MLLVCGSSYLRPPYTMRPPTHLFWARGGTDLERGYGDVRPWRSPFHASPAARKGPISSKRISSQDPLLRKFGNFSLNSLNFHPNFSSQAPKFGHFQLTSPQIWKSSAHKPPPPFQRQMSVRKPHTSEIRAAHPYLKKSWVPSPGVLRNTKSRSFLTPWAVYFHYLTAIIYSSFPNTIALERTFIWLLEEHFILQTFFFFNIDFRHGSMRFNLSHCNRSIMKTVQKYTQQFHQK